MTRTDLKYNNLLYRSQEFASIVTTERVLAKKLSEADRASYNDTAARELSRA